MIKLLRAGLLCMLLPLNSLWAQDVTAVWDFKNKLPEGINSTNIQGSEGTVNSTVDGVKMTVDATNGGKLAGRDSDAQFNKNTKLKIPVKSARDYVTVVSYPGYHNYTIGGVTASADSVAHRATSSEVEVGYVEVEATATSYIYRVKVLHASAIQEKCIYSTDFTDWSEVDRKKATDVVVNLKTKYSKESFSFTLNGVGVYPSGTNTKFPSFTGFMQTAKYTSEYSAAEPSAVTSALASVSKIVFTQAATGGKRGIKVSVKGDEDEDWVAIHDKSIVTSTGEKISLDVNRTNCQIKFENYSLGANAYMTDLAIYGKVDMSGEPLLGTFELNGKAYNAIDIFEEDNSGIQQATILISKKETMISDGNQLANVVAENGSVTGITYTTTGDGAQQKTVASIVVEANGSSVLYNLTIAFKPDLTLTYFDADGVTKIGSQVVEQDATISSFSFGASNVAVSSGSVFRGWSVSTESGKRKFSEADVVTADENLYALVTEIETANTTNRYDYLLNSEYFYAEDHEAFVVDGSGKFHDTTHGWIFSSSDKIILLMGGKGYVKLGLCNYSSDGNLTLTDPNGSVVASVSAKAAKDGSAVILENTSDVSGTYTVTFDGSGAFYIHSLSIVNMSQLAFTKEGDWFVVEPGSVSGLICALEYANASNVASDAANVRIFLPDGIYDLGETVLTNISGNNISIIGQSMDKTIIRNAPLIENEGIGSTATFYVTGTGTYFQDLTIQNALDYYKSGSAGRAVCIQDKGNQTICKNVKMLSYQDTYYSNNNSGQFYWEDSEIHGTVDYICGGGDVYFNRCTLVNESRKEGVKYGSDVIAAPFTNGSDWGYVFNGCTIENLAESFSFARAWGGTPRCAFLNTTINQPSEVEATRYQAEGMSVPADKFVEFNSIDANGSVVSRSSNVIKFYKDKIVKEYETILTADEAAAYALDKVFSKWAPAEATVQATVAVSQEDGKISWTSDASTFAVFKDGVFVTLTSEKEYATDGSESVYTVRAANSRGGFGKAFAAGDETAVSDVVSDADVVSTSFFALSGARLSKLQRGVNIVVTTFADGSSVASRVIVK